MTQLTPPRAERDAEGLVELTARPGPVRYLQQVWKRRDFAAAMPLEELRAEHMNTMLGHIWHLLNPLLLSAIYYFVFEVILGVGRGVDNFAAFLVVGVFTFHYTQKSVLQGSKSLVSNEGLIRSIVFPRVILPTASVVAQTVALLPAVFIMLLLAVATGELPRWTWVLVPAIFLGQGVLNLGGSMIASRLTAIYRDFDNLLPYLFRLVFYGSGILYPVEQFVGEGPLRLLFDLNPVYGFVTLVRWAVMGMPVNPTVIVAVICWSVALLVVGFVFFLRGEGGYGRG